MRRLGGVQEIFEEDQVMEFIKARLDLHLGYIGPTKKVFSDPHPLGVFPVQKGIQCWHDTK